VLQDYEQTATKIAFVVIDNLRALYMLLASGLIFLFSDLLVVCLMVV
jgi:hypothetical protein